MNSLRISFVCVLAFATQASAATIVIDDFTSDTLSAQYTQSLIYTAGSSPNLIYDTTTVTDKLTWRFENATYDAQRCTLLRDDYSLSNDGDAVQIVTSIPSAPTGGSPEALLGGLALDSVTKSPVDRANFLGIQLDGLGQVILLGASPAGYLATGAVSVPVGTEAILRFTRTSATTVLADYSADGGTTFNALGGNVTVAGFNALGVYNGLARITAVGTVVYDNLTMTPIPEPSSVVILVSSLVGLLAYAWRKRRQDKMSE